MAPLQDQSDAERQLESGLYLVRAGSVSVTEECMKILLPFVCLLTFPLVHCDSDNDTAVVFRPAQSRCRSIENGVCRDLARQFNLESNLSDCDADEMFQPQRDILSDCQCELVYYCIV